MFDLEDFKYNFVNLTTFRMVDIEDVGVREVLKHMEKYSSEKNQTINKFMLTQVGRAEYCTVNTFVEQKYETRKPRVTVLGET